MFHDCDAQLSVVVKMLTVCVFMQVYRQDCDTFGVVVKMLIAKDPSLEQPIQSSLQENLREIGLRCVEAMQEFIEEYDSREPSTVIRTHAPLS